jgi:Raf kinase inhibitor-like YbhB/YbcL family protein
MLTAATVAAAFALTSPAFTSNGTIPRRYTCDGANVSPALRWTAPPRGTRSLALLVNDPDAPAGTFTHWLGWNISVKARSLRAGQHAPAEGRNDAGGVGYTGPCPPSGVHRYVFRLYALDRPLALLRGASAADFTRALRGHVLRVATLVGRYGR